MKLILLGAPGAGKGTQAELLQKALQAPVISTGNLLRAAIAEGSKLGLAAKEYMDGGRLVPDELIISLVQEKLAAPECAHGAIFDGFPRTVAQAEALDGIGGADAALSIEVSDAEIEERMCGRRTCPNCQTTYHIMHNPPRREGVCDKCGAALGIRKDDEPGVVKERLRIYHEQTEPLIEYYRAQGKLREVPGQGTVTETTALIFKALGICS